MESYWLVDEEKQKHFELLGKADHFKNLDPNFIRYKVEESLDNERWYIYIKC